MKPITERRRQELIDDCVAEIERLNRRLSTYGEQWRTYIESQLERQKVALASLTAEPFVYVNAVTVRNGVVASLVANGVGLYDGNLPVELYPAPPVPVIKLQSVLRAMKKSDEVSDLYPSQILIIAEDIIKYLNASGE